LTAFVPGVRLAFARIPALIPISRAVTLVPLRFCHAATSSWRSWRNIALRSRKGWARWKKRSSNSSLRQKRRT